MSAEIDAADFFRSQAKLLGVITLSDLMTLLETSARTHGTTVQRMATEFGTIPEDLVPKLVKGSGNP